MEITGGRKSEDVQYEMPGLKMRVFSKQSQLGLEGGGEIHFVPSCAWPNHPNAHCGYLWDGIHLRYFLPDP